ncbi:hypothetical protein QUB30_15820 [Microcoleus sp. BROC3]
MRPLSVKARSLASAISNPHCRKVDRPQLLPVSEPLLEAETGFLTKISCEAPSLGI